jgi:hypothetical protein
VKWRRPSNPLGSAVWTHDGVVCIGVILKERIRLSFPAGSTLADPAKLFNAQLLGKSRAIDFRKGEELDQRALKAIIRASVEHNRARANPGKRGIRSSTEARTQPRRTKRTRRER